MSVALISVPRKNGARPGLQRCAGAGARATSRTLSRSPAQGQPQLVLLTRRDVAQMSSSTGTIRPKERASRRSRADRGGCAAIAAPSRTRASSQRYLRSLRRCLRTCHGIFETFMSSPILLVVPRRVCRFAFVVCKVADENADHRDEVELTGQHLEYRRARDLRGVFGGVVENRSSSER